MKYYSEENNGQGQQKMITKGKLRGYINWLNETKGGSFLRATASGSNRLVIERMNDISSGTIHWTATRDTQSSQLTASTTASSITITSNYSSRIPRGKFYLVGPDGTQYTELDNSNGGDNYSGFEDMAFIEADEKLDTYCLTYSDLSGGTYARVFDVSTMKDGIVIDGYSISSSGQYKANQLVAEKDVNFGKLTYDLVVSSITVEVDAMNDLEEYRRGVIPGSNGLAYATVYDVTNGTETPFYNFDLNGAELTDNAQTSGKTYSGVTISKGGNIAKASKRKSGSTDVYAVDVYFYADSGYTLSSQTIATKVGNASDKYISASTHSFSSNSTSPSYSATSRMVKISIASNGEVKFDIKQRKEIYGYFPVSVYKQGTSDFAIDENGNVELSAINKFINADSGSTMNSYRNVLDRSVGWLSNAGDNFGSFGLTNGEKYLSSDVSSTYNDELIREGFPESALTEVCGKDVYNIDDTVYNRGEEVGLDTGYTKHYHIAYANDVYDSYRGLDKVGGFSGTTHLFIDKGYLNTSAEKGDCTSEYLDYTFDSFTSEYNYIVDYVRDYYKDVHSYGITSILRRYRNINGSFVDTSSSYKLVNAYSSSNPSGYTPKAFRNIKINGNNFPKHVSGKTISLTITLGWNDATNEGSNDKYKSGDNYISGWTTIYEYPRYDEWWGSSSDSNAVSGSPTVREIRYVPSSKYHDEGRIECQANTSDTIYYYNIAPRFYMVDAESCSGGTSGYNYTFKILSTPITDKAYGITEDRYYFLDYDGFLGHSGEKAVNNQMARKNMITYLSVSSATPTFDSIRYGSTKLNSLYQTLNEYNIQSGCCPSAPTQRVYWVDTYAPTDSQGKIYCSNSLNGENVTTSIPLTYIDDDNKIIESGSTEYVVPGVNSYDFRYYDHQIGIDDINKFASGKTNYIFAGQVYYNGYKNDSEHNLIESISFASGLSESVYGASGVTGYSVNDSYNNGNPMHVLSSTTNYIISGDSKIYTGTSNGYYEHVYFDRNGKPNGTLISKNAQPTYNYVPQIYSNIHNVNPNFPITTALRPCFGDVTVPYWRTSIEFAVRVLEQPEDELTFDPITQFGLTIDASFDNTNYTRLTTGGTEYNNVRHKLVTDTDDDIVYISDPYEKSYKGIYGYLSKTGSLIAGVDSYYQKMHLDLVFVDVYPVNSTFDIVVNGPTHTGGQQKLHWRLDGKTSQSVGADIFGSLGSNGWGRYKENTKTNTLSCIGDTNNMYSVSHMLIVYALDEGYDIMPFADMLTEDFAVDGTSNGGKGTWY